MTNKTKITPELLLQKGFKVQIIDGKTFFNKGKVGIYLEQKWKPCNKYFGLPLDTNIYIENWEGLECLANEAGIDIDD